jgi:hypothetical protein
MLYITNGRIFGYVSEILWKRISDFQSKRQHASESPSMSFNLLDAIPVANRDAQYSRAVAYDADGIPWAHTGIAPDITPWQLVN